MLRPPRPDFHSVAKIRNEGSISLISDYSKCGCGCIKFDLASDPPSAASPYLPCRPPTSAARRNWGLSAREPTPLLLGTVPAELNHGFCKPRCDELANGFSVRRLGAPDKSCDAQADQKRPAKE